MKTRSNMPLFVLEVSDVKALSNSQIDLLRCGDWLVKKDASGEHPYQVTFKKEGVGMCLTYHDASVIETQSYDWNNSLKKWVYNIEDKTPNLLDAQTESDIIDLLGSGDVPSVKADEIIENMSGYSFELNNNPSIIEIVPIFAGACKNGNKLTFVVFGKITKQPDASGSVSTFSFNIPESVGSKIYPITFAGTNTRVDTKKVLCANTLTSGADLFMWCDKVSATKLSFGSAITPLTVSTEYIFRYELTLLLGENLAE